jgi:alkyl sulfatase BDS1-like metallo-beta-lactamase superfamily hydrolase
VPTAGGINTASPDTIKAMTPEMTFDYFSVRLNGEKAAGKKIALNITFTDLKRNYSLVVENGVLNHARRHVPNADATLTLSKGTLDRIQLGEIKAEQAITAGEMKLTGKREALTEFVGMLDNFPFWFNIVTP